MNPFFLANSTSSSLKSPSGPITTNIFLCRELIIASFKDRPEIFFQTVQNSIENTEIAFNDRLDIYKGAGRDTSQFEGFFSLREPTGARVGVTGMAREPITGASGVTSSGKKFTIE